MSTYCCTYIEVYTNRTQSVSTVVVRCQTLLVQSIHALRTFSPWLRSQPQLLSFVPSSELYHDFTSRWARFTSNAVNSGTQHQTRRRSKMSVTAQVLLTPVRLDGREHTILKLWTYVLPPSARGHDVFAWFDRLPVSLHACRGRRVAVARNSISVLPFVIEHCRQSMSIAGCHTTCADAEEVHRRRQ